MLAMHASGFWMVECQAETLFVLRSAQALQEQCGDAARVHGLPADCSNPEDMERLGQWVKERLGGVDIWLNNAGKREGTRHAPAATVTLRPLDSLPSPGRWRHCRAPPLPPSLQAR